MANYLQHHTLFKGLLLLVLAVTVLMVQAGAPRECPTITTDDLVNGPYCTPNAVKTPGSLIAFYRATPDLDRKITEFLDGYGFEKQGKKVQTVGTYSYDDPTIFSKDQQYLYSSIAVKVPAGYERAWSDVFRDANLFLEVSRSDLMLAMVDRSINLYDLGYRDPKPHSKTRLKVPSDLVMEQVLNWIRTFYQQKGQFALRKQEHRRLHIDVDGMKKEILSSENFWEKITLLLIQSGTGNDTVLYIVLDASYASGLGSTAPPPSSYRSMENKFSNETALYADKLTVELKAGLEAQR